MKTNTLLGIIFIGVGAFAYQGITYTTRLLWGLGLVSNYTMGVFVHLLLAVAITAMLLSVIQVRKKSVSRWGTEALKEARA